MHRGLLANLDVSVGPVQVYRSQSWTGVYSSLTSGRCLQRRYLFDVAAIQVWGHTQLPSFLSYMAWIQFLTYARVAMTIIYDACLQENWKKTKKIGSGADCKYNAIAHRSCTTYFTCRARN